MMTTTTTTTTMMIGANKGEGVVITRDRLAALDRYNLDPLQGRSVALVALVPGHFLDPLSPLATERMSGQNTRNIPNENIKSDTI